MNCKKCKHFDFYVHPDDPDQRPIIWERLVKRDNCSHYLTGDDSDCNPCPILKSKWHKRWINFLWWIGYYPLDATQPKTIEPEDDEYITSANHRMYRRKDLLEAAEKWRKKHPEFNQQISDAVKKHQRGIITVSSRMMENKK